jgi:N-acetylglucosaminyldiphosphoundecaprenol N-acetyl-beta-D-mannosaminyltransferase
MKNNKLLGIEIHAQNKDSILYKIQKNMHTGYAYMQIVSLNPENMVIASSNKKFNKVLSESAIQLIDGVGIKIGGFLTGIETPKRISGADFISEILSFVEESEPRVLLLGGKGNVAEKLVECYSLKYTKIKFKGLRGIEDIYKKNEAEINKILSIVADFKPHLIFCAFGSPAQELFLEEHKDKLRGITCMGVGGGFDFATGRVKRAPQFIRKLGFEWLFRLVIQPWRISRQLKLIIFILLILQEKLKSLLNHDR